MFRKFNDFLALLLAVIVFPMIWILTSLKMLAVPDIVVGATISIETLICQYYFRKAPAETPDNPPINPVPMPPMTSR